MAKTKIDKDDIKRLVENTSNPTSTTSVYSAKYVDDNFLKEITKEAIEAKLTGDITSHDHDTTYLGIGDTAADSDKLGGELPSYYEPAFDKNTAFNEDFGTGNSDVARGDHGHSDLHSHGNKDILDDITAAFTTELETSYDDAVTNSHTHDNLDALDEVLGVNTGDEDTTTIGSLINEANEKTTPEDADMVGLMDSDSAASNLLKKLSWANIKTTLKTYFDALYATSVQGDLADSSLQPTMINDLSNDYLPKWDDTNNKFSNSSIYDDGTTLKYGANTIWHSGNDGSLSELDADLLDGNHASDFAIVDHDHDYPTSTDVQTLINTAVASVYKIKGNIADKTALLDLINVKQGDVYNAQASFTLIDGQNVQNVKAGDNIVCLSDAATSEEDNWDNLCGNVDNGDLGDMPVATDTEVGGIKIGFTGIDRSIPVQLDTNNNKAYIDLFAYIIRYVMENDPVIPASRYWLRNKTIIVPDDSLDEAGFSEGLRIANNQHKYSLIALGTESTSSGLNSDDKQWNIIKHPTGELTISFDNDNQTGLTLYKNGNIYWRGARLNFPRVTPLVSGWLDTEDFRRFDRVADHAQITLTSGKLSFGKDTPYIGGKEIFVNGNDSPDFDDFGLYDDGSYNLAIGRRYEVIINMGMNVSTGGLVTLQLEETDVGVIKSTPSTHAGYVSMSLSCIVGGGIPITVSIQKGYDIELDLENNQCWFAVHEIK